MLPENQCGARGRTSRLRQIKSLSDEPSRRRQLVAAVHDEHGETQPSHLLRKRIREQLIATDEVCESALRVAGLVRYLPCRSTRVERPATERSGWKQPDGLMLPIAQQGRH